MISRLISGLVDLGKDNDVRLLRLRTALALSTGFQLVVVEAEPGPIRNGAIRRIQSWAGREPIGALAAVSLDADATLPAQLSGKSGVILFGLEAPSPTEAPARDWIAELNWSRDALPGLVPGPLILVVSQTTHRDLFERAPDLYSWRRHTTRVTVTVPELAFPLSSPGDHYWLEQRRRLTEILVEGETTKGRPRVILLSLADVLMQLGDENSALRLLDEAASPDSRSPGGDESYKIKIGRAEFALQRRDLAAARALLDEVMSPHVGVLPSSRTAKNFVGLLRAKLLAAEGAWNPAAIELSRAAQVEPASELHVLVLAREGLCQVALARGEIADARREIADLIRVANPCLDAWGTGLLLRVAEVVVDVYPDEILPLLEATFVSARLSQWTDTMVAIQCLRARRASRLGRIELAREELVRAKRWIRTEDPSEVHASICLSEAEVALVAGVGAKDDIAGLLVRARELFRSTAPRQAAVSGTLLGEYWRHLGRAELAVDAYQVAADDARKARAPTLAANAELGELGAAVEGGVEQDDTMDRLRAIADRFCAAEQAQSEGIARTDLGLCLLRRGFRAAAFVELEQARACFVATTDAISESRVVAFLDAARRDRTDLPTTGG